MRISKRLAAATAITALAVTVPLAACTSASASGPGGAKNGAPAPSYTSQAAAPTTAANLDWSCSIINIVGMTEAQVTVTNPNSTPVAVKAVTYQAYESIGTLSETLRPRRIIPAGRTVELGRQQLVSDIAPEDMIPQSCAVVRWTQGSTS